MKSFWLVFAVLELGFQATCAKKSTFLHFLDSFIGEIPFLVTYSVVFLCNEWAISPHTEFDIIYQKTLVCDVILALSVAVWNPSSLHESKVIKNFIHFTPSVCFCPCFIDSQTSISPTLTHGIPPQLPKLHASFYCCTPPPLIQDKKNCLKLAMLELMTVDVQFTTSCLCHF